MVKIDKLLQEKSREQWASWTNNCLLTEFLKIIVQNLVFVLDIMGSDNKINKAQILKDV